MHNKMKYKGHNVHKYRELVFEGYRVDVYYVNNTDDGKLYMWGIIGENPDFHINEIEMEINQRLLGEHGYLVDCLIHAYFMFRKFLTIEDIFKNFQKRVDDCEKLLNSETDSLAINIPESYDAKIEGRKIIFAKKKNLLNKRMTVSPYILKGEEPPYLRVEKPGGKIILEIIEGHVLLEYRNKPWDTCEQSLNAKNLFRYINTPYTGFRWDDDEESISDLERIVKEAFKDNVIFNSYSGVVIRWEELR